MVISTQCINIAANSGIRGPHSSGLEANVGSSLGELQQGPFSIRAACKCPVPSWGALCHNSCSNSKASLLMGLIKLLQSAFGFLKFIQKYSCKNSFRAVGQVLRKLYTDQNFYTHFCFSVLKKCL